jgi:hypothetical protein
MKRALKKKKSVNNKYNKFGIKEVEPINTITFVLIFGSFMLTCAAIAFTIHDYTTIQKLYQSPNLIIEGFSGKPGKNGYDVTYNPTTIESIEQLAVTIYDTIHSYDFCKNSTCEDLDSFSSDITTLIDSNTLSEIDIPSIIENVLITEEITTNDTFCKLSDIDSIFSFIETYAPLVDNGTNDNSLTLRSDALGAIFTNGTYVSFPLDNDDISNGSISLYKFDRSTGLSAVITSSSASVTTEVRLSTSKGGTNVNSTSFSGVVYVSSGVWNATTPVPKSYLNLTGLLTDGEFASSIQINGSKVLINGSSGAVINDANGYLNYVQYLNASLGGFGTSASAANGYPFWTSGSVIFGTLGRTIYTVGCSDCAVYNNASGYISSEQYLSTIRGGTGQNSSAWNGYVRVYDGVWTATDSTILLGRDFNFTGQLTNSELSSSILITRSKFATGTADHVVINDPSGILSSEAQLATIRGGTGINTNSSTGFLKIDSGIWSVSQLYKSNITTAASFIDSDFSTSAAISRSKIAIVAGNPNHVLVNDVGGSLGSVARLPTSSGGTNADTSLFSNNNIFRITAGTWAGLTSVTYAQTNLTDGIVNADISTGTTITRSKFATGTINHVVINGPTGALSSEAQLNPVRGGTGIDTTGLSGFPIVVSGTWSITNYVASTTYSPLLTFGNLNTGIVQLITRGKYTRIGVLVFVEMYVILSSKGTAVGTARISLPVAVASTTGSGARGFLQNNIDMGIEYYTVALIPDQGTTTAILSTYGDNVGRLNLNNTVFADSSSLQVAFSYFAA